MAEWQTATAFELQHRGILLVEDGNHGEYRPRPDEFVENGVAFIRAADIDDGMVLFESASKINDRARRRITKGIGAGGDVLLSHKGTVGKVALTPEDAPQFVCSPQTTLWRTLDQDILDRRYLHAFIRSPAFHQQLASRAGETDMAPYVSLTSQRTLTVTLPPIGVQRSIGRILGALDDKIKFHREFWSTIETTLRTLFKGWFLDSSLGAAWRKEPLGEHVEVARGLSYTSEGLVAEGVPLHNLDSIREGGGYKHGGMKHYAGEFQERHLVRPGDLVVGNTDLTMRARVIGCPAIIPSDYGQEGLFSQDLFRVDVRAGSPLTSRFLYLLLCDRRFRGLVTGYSNGTTVNHLALDGLLRPKLAVPPAELVARFDELTDPLFARQAALHGESTLLARLRDLLLPRLLSGELLVRHPDAVR